MPDGRTPETTYDLHPGERYVLVGASFKRRTPCNAVKMYRYEVDAKGREVLVEVGRPLDETAPIPSNTD